MTFELPKRKYLVQKAIDASKLSKKKQEDFKENFLRNYSVEVKYDGCHCIVVVTKAGEVLAFSRQGLPVLSIDHILDQFRDRAETYDYVYFGEVWNKEDEHEVINGKFRRSTTQQDLMLVLFDCVPLDDFIAGRCDTKHMMRRHFASRELTYDLPKTLVRWSDQSLPTFQHELGERVDTWRGMGYPYVTDGYIIVDNHAPWVAGAGREGYLIKDKDTFTVDIRVVGVLEGEGKFANAVGSFVAAYHGHNVQVQGGALTTAERIAIWRDPASVIGRIIEVQALGVNSSGKLREPRFLRWRDDKLAHEVD